MHRAATSSSKLLFCLLIALSANARPIKLRCEYLTNPLGIDVPQPRLSWQSDSVERNWHQSAYRILVGSTLASLGTGKPDIWDSGKQASPESDNIPYSGPALESRKRYFWSVRVWDAKDSPSEPTETSFWETGLLNRADWTAQWIRWENPDDAADRAGIQWIWAQPDASAVKPGTVAIFRHTFHLDELPAQAALFTAVRGKYKATVNGKPVGAKTDWKLFQRDEIATALVKGDNTVEIAVTVLPHSSFGPDASPPDSPRAAGLASLIKLTKPDGSVVRMPTGTDWQARLEQARLEADSSFHPASSAGPLASPDSGPLTQPAALLRQAFNVEKPVASARIYATALGAYRLSINGKRVSEDELTPGFTDFGKRANYQTYDVTGLIMKGANNIGAMLGDGWFASPMAWTGEHFAILPPTRLMAQLEIVYNDGSRTTVGTDGTWKAAPSPILQSTIYGGETYDARLEVPAWDKPGFQAPWSNAVVAAPPAIAISSEPTPAVHRVETLRPHGMTALPGGVQIFDMGQNMVGWIALRVKGKAGDTVRMRFAEILNPDGSIYRENLRNADSTDFYTLRGGGIEIFRPHFTFHGFRYVEVTGYPGTPTLDDLRGEVLSSIDSLPTGTLETSSNLVNRMYHIGLWGQRGNFLSIPTDCPQRDERLGWMGDAGVFWRTGAYNFDIAAFTHKWMLDVDDAQTPTGAFTNTSPDIGVGNAIDGAPGWSDAGIIVPWTAWIQYGDKGLVRQDWDAMDRFMKFIADANPDFLRTQKLGPNFADWLAPDPNTDKSLIATAYWAMMANMMRQMAIAVDRQPDAERYSHLFEEIRDAFQKKYVKDDGTVGTGTQTSYVLALHMNLLPEALKKPAVDRLVKDIDAHGGHLSTGFLGTPHLLFALADNGRADVAYKLLLTETYPSWGYMLSKGATTWWERWNGDTGDPSMNSFNHYAFGSVVAWVYRSVAGIDTTPDGPGFREILIHPHFDSAIAHSRGEYQSPYGKIVTDWITKPEGPISLKVTIPANTTARIVLPDMPHATLTEGGNPVDAKHEADGLIVSIGSGSYDFEVK